MNNFGSDHHLELLWPYCLCHMD